MLDQTSRPLRTPGISWPVLFLTSLPVGALVLLAFVSRIYGFWFLSRWPRLFLFAIGALGCSFLIGLLLRSAWLQLAAAPRAGKLLWLAVAIAAGVLIMAMVGGQPPAIPILYVLDISTPGNGAPATGKLEAGDQKDGPVVFIELRDYTGRPVLPIDIRMEGNWQRIDEGWVAQSDQPARLHYSFYAPPKGMLQVLFGEQPGSGQVQVMLNEQSQQVDLSSPVSGQRLVELPFQKQSRWEMPVLIADLVLAGLALPLFLFVIPFYAVGGARWCSPRLGSAAGWLSARLDYQKVFIVAFLGLCLLPLLDYKGDLTSVERFFLQGNTFWNVYSRVRQNVFGDRFIGAVLVAEDGWLVLANNFSLEDYQNTIPLTQEELYQIQQRIDGTTRYLKKQGIKFLVVIPPNKNTIYPERIPAQVQVIGKQSRLDQLLAYQHLHGEAQILDLRPPLLEARKEHLLFYKTDTHWNSYGAHAGYVGIMEELQKAFPELPGLKPHALDDYLYESDGEGIGDMGRRWAQGAPLEPFFRLSPKFDRQIHTFNASHDRVLYSYRYNQIDSNLPNAVIFHDSFMDSLAPFLTDHFRRVVYVRALDAETGMDEILIESEKPDIVIYQCTELGLKRLLYLPQHDNQEK